MAQAAPLARAKAKSARRFFGCLPDNLTYGKAMIIWTSARLPGNATTEIVGSPVVIEVEGRPAKVSAQGGAVDATAATMSAQNVVSN